MGIRPITRSRYPFAIHKHAPPLVIRATSAPIPASSLAHDPTLPDNGPASRSAAPYDDSP
jgi:hypothetical protein